MTKFCRDICGTCPQCLAARKELDDLEQTLASLSADDAASITKRDPDDPHTFALDHKGRP